MFKNYLVITYRNLLKHRTFSAINILGLAVGITCCLLLALFIQDELSYEKHFNGYEDIYRVTSAFIRDGGEEQMPRTSPPVMMAMLSELPDLASGTRVVSPPEVDRHLIRYNEKTFYETDGYLVDSTFFDVFSYKFREGDSRTALHSPSSVVLSDQVATKIFGSTSALDQLLIINSGNSADTFRVTGVLAPFEGKSQVDANFYMCMNSKGWGEYINGQTTWVGQNFIYSFIKVKPKTNLENLREKLNGLLVKYGSEQMKEFATEKSMNFQPLSEMHLYSQARFQSGFSFMDIGTSGNIRYIYTIGSISLFILIIACINFMNLTTAKATQRAGEVGVRKSLGASRSNLIRQFLGESLTIVALAVILSIGLAQLVLPLFNEFTQKTLSMQGTNILFIGGALAAIALVTGLIAGSYPAFFLSAFQPIEVLKDKRLSGGKANQYLRQGLVVFQFIITITLVSSVLVIEKQMYFIQNKELGFNADLKITLPLRTVEAKENYAQLKSELSRLSSVSGITASTSLPGSPTYRDIPLYPDGSNMENSARHYNVGVDVDYLETLGLRLLKGRNLTHASDSFSLGGTLNNILVNRASLKATHIDMEDAVGSSLFIDWQGQKYAFNIVGVVDDFHQLSMHREMDPMIFTLPSSGSYVEMCVSLNAGNYQSTLAQIETGWKQVIPNTPFEFTFLTDNIKHQYDADTRIFGIITTFTIIAILISCLGLYGLSIYVAERKVKEIGIRKTLGATASSIVSMLSKDFVKLVALASFAAIPLGYYVMNLWLEGFAYRTDLSFWVFLAASALSFGLAWGTICFESIKAAYKNPVESLRIE